jgi:raffinose/stachyose/melibiose transport system permease protein
MQSRLERVGTYAVLTLFALIVLFPVVQFVLAALSPSEAGTPDLTDLRWSNFSDAWRQADFAHAMVASLVVATAAVAGQVVVAVLAGFGLGVLGAVGERVIFPLILLGMMISTEAIIVPLYYQFRDLGLTNSWWGLIIIQIGMGVPFGTFWMRATFRALPQSLVDCARLDGAGSIRLLWSVLLPVARPAVLTLVLLSFMWTWNDYFLALVFLGDPDLQTAPLALGAFQGRFNVEINLMAAAGLMVAAPVLLLYAAFQRSFIQGILAGAIKE